MSHVKFNLLKLRLQEKRHTTLSLAGAAHASRLVRRDTAPVGSEAQLQQQRRTGAGGDDGGDGIDADSDALPPPSARWSGAAGGGDAPPTSSHGVTLPPVRSTVSGLVFTAQEQAAVPRARAASVYNGSVSPRLSPSSAAAATAAIAAAPAVALGASADSGSEPASASADAHYRFLPTDPAAIQIPASAVPPSAMPPAAVPRRLDVVSPSERRSPLIRAQSSIHPITEEQEADHAHGTLISARQQAHAAASSRSCCFCLPSRDAPFWNTQFRLVWDVLLALITVYYFVCIPLRIGQYQHWDRPDRLQLWAFIDYPLDAMLIVDIILRCVVFLPLDEEFFGGDEDADAALAALDDDEDDEEQEPSDADAAGDARRAAGSAPSWSSRNRIFLLYLRGYFTWDVLGSLPLDMVAIHLGVNTIPFLRLNKLIRLKRFATFWGHFPDTVEHVVRIGPNVWRLFSYAAAHLLIAHWSACGWCFVGQISLECPTGLDSCTSNEPNWLQFDDLEHAEFSTRYARAIYGCASTLFTVGLGDVRPLTTLETVYFACVATLGGIMCARLSAAGASIYSKMEAARFAHDKKMLDLKAYMSHKYLPADLQARVLYYHDYLWQSARGRDERKVLESLPSHLRMEALVFLEGDAIRKVPFLTAASAGLINSIALVLQPSLFSPDSYISVKGQRGEQLFLVHKGECARIEELDAPELSTIAVGNAKGAGAVDGARTKILSVLQSGSYIFELDIFPPEIHPSAPHTHSIKSLTFLELFKLSRTDFVKVILLCCRNNAAEAELEMRAMYRHQLSHTKSHSKVMKLLGGLDGAAYGTESPVERSIRNKWYYSLMRPSSWFRTTWLLLSNLIVLFWLGWLPFRIAFMYSPYNLTLNASGEPNTVADHSSPRWGGTPSDLFLWWLLLDIACDVFFAIDVALKCKYFFFHRTVKEEEKEKQRHQQRRDQPMRNDSDDVGDSSSSRLLHTRPDQIYARYRQTYLLIDCVSSLPIDYLIGATLGWQWAAIPRLLRLLRLHILRSSFVDFRRWALSDAGWQMNPDLFTLVAFFHAYLVLMHLVACVWYGSGMLAMRYDTDSWLLNERDPSTGLLDPPTTDSAYDTTALLRNYVRSLYYACTTTTTTAGYRDVLAYGAWESIVCAGMIVSLALTYYLSMGCIAVLLSQISSAEHQHQERMDTLLTFIQQHTSPTALAEQRAGKKPRRHYADGLSLRLAQSIKSYYTYLWFRQRGVKEEQILAELPTALREEVAVALNLAALQSLTLFSGCSSALLQCILNQFRSHIFLPNEYIVRAHDVATEMLILNRGRAVVVSANESLTLELLNRGSVYGEALFLMQLRRKASVKTLNFCDVSLLSTSDFHAAISSFPAERQRLFENSVAVRKRQVRNDQSMAGNRKLAKVRQLMAQSSAPTKPRYTTFSPTSAFVRNWQLLLIALSVYHCVMIPLRIAFVHVTPLEVLFVEYGFDAVFWIDIYLQMYRFSFVQHNGHLCTDPQLIGAHYRGDGFWFDVLASTPLDFVALGLSRGTGDWVEVMAYLRLPRALRTVRIPAYFRRLRTFVQEAELGLEVNYLRLIELGVAIVLISHWMGCFFFWMARMQYGVGIEPRTYTWLHAYGIHGADLTTQYLASLYWALGSITAVCFGDITPLSVWEHVYVALSAIFCLFLVATLIGDTAGLLTRLDASATALSHKLNRFDEYARRHGLPERLQQRVHQYWIHQHKLQRGVDEEELLDDMPTMLRTAIATARYLKYLQALPYFSFCEPNLLQQLCEALKVEIFIPGDVILLEEDLGRKLYIVKQSGFAAIVKRGVRGPNQAKHLRRLAYKGGRSAGGDMPTAATEQNGRVSPVRPRPSHRRLGPLAGGKRLEPILPIGQIAQQLHQSKHGDAHSTSYRSPLATSPSRARLGLHRRTGAGGSGSWGGRSHPTTPVRQGSNRNAAGGHHHTPAIELSHLSPSRRAKSPRSPSSDKQQRAAGRMGASPKSTRPHIDVDGDGLDESDDDEPASPLSLANGSAHAASPTASHLSLRDILGTSLLYDVSYAQDGIVLSGVVDVAGSASAVGAAASPKQQAPLQSSPRLDGHNGGGAGIPIAHSVESAPIILQLDEGMMLGELSFFLPLRRTASVYATTFCTFLVLDRKPFNATMQSLPHYVAKMRDLARRSVQEQAMKHAAVRRNFTQHTRKLRKMCMLAATQDEKNKWGPEFLQRTASRASELKRRVWLPHSSFYQWWKLLMLLLLLYHLVVVPFRICFFPAFPDLSARWLICDYAIDLLTAVDLYLNLNRFGFIDDTLGVARTSAEEIAANYKRTTNFKVDLLALLPIDILALGWVSSRYTARERLFVRLLLRVGKLLRVVQLMGLVRALAPTEKKLLRAVSRVGIGLDEGGVRFGKMLAVFCLASHWFGSLWFVVGYESTVNGAAAWSRNYLYDQANPRPVRQAPEIWKQSLSWLHQDGIISPSALELRGSIEWIASGTRVYVRSVYYAAKSLCTLGVADLTATNPNETGFTLLLIAASAMMLSLFVSVFEKTLRDADDQGAAFHQQMEYNRSFMKAKRLPAGLQDRINLYYSYMWNRSKGVDESQALATLSSHLRKDVMMHKNKEIIELVSLFRECDAGFVKSIALVLQAAVFMPDDIIIRAGTSSAHMYFVKEGVVAMERQGSVLMELGEGDFFGEGHLLSVRRPSPSNFVALTFCDVYTLSKAHFEEVVEYYPRYRQTLVWKMSAINAQKRKEAAAGKGGATTDNGATNTATATMSPTPALQSPSFDLADGNVAPAPSTPKRSTAGTSALHPSDPHDPEAEAEPEWAPIHGLEAATAIGGSDATAAHALQPSRPDQAHNSSGVSSPAVLASEEKDGPRVLRIHPGRLDPRQYTPQPQPQPQSHPRTTVEPDVLVPSFRLTAGPGRNLPSPDTYQNSMGQLGDFREHDAPDLAVDGSPVASRPAPEESPSANDRVQSPSPPSGLLTPFGTGFRPPPLSTAAPHRAIIFTPMPRSVGPTSQVGSDEALPTPSSAGGPVSAIQSPLSFASPQPSPRSPTHAAPSIPLLRVSGNTPQALSLGEPATLTFHLPPVLSPRRLNAPPRASALSPTSAQASPSQQWPPGDLDIDESMRDQLARMPYVGGGLTDAARGQSSPSSSALPPMPPPDVTPLSPMLAAWMRSSHVLPERVRFPSDRLGSTGSGTGTGVAARSPRTPHAVLDITVDEEDEESKASTPRRTRPVIRAFLGRRQADSEPAGTPLSYSIDVGAVDVHVPQDDEDAPRLDRLSLLSPIISRASSVPPQRVQGAQPAQAATPSVAAALAVTPALSVDLPSPSLLRPPAAPSSRRSKSHDLTSGADLDLQRLLSSTATRVAQHLHQPSPASPTATPASRRARDAPASDSHHLSVHPSHAARRHSFNAAILAGADADEAEPTFKSVFDF